MENRHNDSFKLDYSKLHGIDYKDKEIVVRFDYISNQILENTISHFH